MKSAIITTSCVVGALADGSTSTATMPTMEVGADRMGASGMAKPTPAAAPTPTKAEVDAKETQAPTDSEPAKTRSPTPADVKEHKPEEKPEKTPLEKVMEVEELKPEHYKVEGQVVTEYDPYEVLGVKSDSDKSTIRKAYLKLAGECHPDKHTATEEENKQATAATAKLNACKFLFEDEEARKAYDTWKAKQDVVKDGEFGQPEMPHFMRYGRRHGPMGHMGPGVHVIRLPAYNRPMSLHSLLNMLRFESMMPSMSMFDHPFFGMGMGMPRMNFGMPSFRYAHPSVLSNLLRHDGGMDIEDEIAHLQGRVGAPAKGVYSSHTSVSSTFDEEGNKITTTTTIVNGEKTVKKEVFDKEGKKISEETLEEPKKAIEQEETPKIEEEPIEEPVDEEEDVDGASTQAVVAEEDILE